jgi:hypothetical protein
MDTGRTFVLVLLLCLGTVHAVPVHAQVVIEDTVEDTVDVRDQRPNVQSVTSSSTDGDSLFRTPLPVQLQTKRSQRWVQQSS